MFWKQKTGGAEGVKEICSKERINVSSVKACSDNKKFIGTIETYKIWTPQPKKDRCYEHDAENKCTYRVVGDYECTLMQYSDFKIEKSCQKEELCVEENPGQPFCKPYGVLEREVRSCVNAYCEGEKVKLTEVKNAANPPKTNGGKVYCCDKHWWVNTKGESWKSYCNGGWYAC